MRCPASPAPSPPARSTRFRTSPAQATRRPTWPAPCSTRRVSPSFRGRRSGSTARATFGSRTPTRSRTWRRRSNAWAPGSRRSCARGCGRETSRHAGRARRREAGSRPEVDGTPIRRNQVSTSRPDPGAARSVAVAALLATMGVAAPAAAFQSLPYESPAVALDCDGSVEALAVGDVDGDGLDDFVTRRFHGGNLPHDEVVVQFGMTAGIGPRHSVVELPLSTSFELVLADFDGDGGKEVALFSRCSDCPGSTNVRIWGCAPDRTFTLEATVPAVFLPWGNNVLSHTGLASGDFDDDGDLDLVAGQIGGVAMHRNDGGWAFTHAASIPFPDSRILSGDFDGNGRPDIVGQPDTGGELRLALFSGAGFSFQVHTTTVPGTVGIDLAAGDLDGDGADEIVRLASPNGRVDVWGGTGGLVPRATMPSTSGTSAVSVGDVDGDGRRDLAVAAGPTHRFAWYVNEGNFAFAAAQSREAGGPPSDLAWSDVDLDGRLDPLVANTSGVGIVAYPSAGTVTGLSSS